MSAKFLMWCTIFCVISANPGQMPKPKFLSIECESYSKVYTELDAPQGVRVSWQTENTDRVFISGFEKAQRANGEIEGPGSWDFVAVGPGGAAYQPVVCVLKANSSPRPATAYHISHELMFLPNSSLKKIITTKHTLKDIGDRIIQVLQSMRFPATEDPSIAIKNNIYIFTPEFVQMDSIGDKRIERQVAFQILVKPDEATSTDTYEIQILPAVMRRFKMEGGDFQVDPDATKVGMPMAETLFEAVKGGL